MTDPDERRRKRERRVAWVVRLGTPVFRLLASTWRIQQVNRGPSRMLHDSGHPVILILWHGELLPLLWHYRGGGITILVSEHGDGEIVARVAESFGIRLVRGSTTRGAARALLGMIQAVKGGSVAAFTPDGPRGPARSFAPGALIVAQRTGAPLVALRVAASRSWRLRSWDSFMIPKPFARITVAYGDPAYVRASSPRDAAAEADRFSALLDHAGAVAAEHA